MHISMIYHNIANVESTNFYDILKKEGHSKEEILHILQERSRDNARTPMQWNSKQNAGFTDGTPWLSVIDNYKLSMLKMHYRMKIPYFIIIRN